ncbi:Tetratricopeptide TPR_1 repeat-containing protein [Thermodesulfobium narugense DSM 14796]|uniref:Tetratricopeptide TPR_1 repeat-containing protein n=1 Tax=Thermodesulfobium narugense DSM 14796 TaxID=747365 RepID=M1E6Q7_9BACT|nr:tetratricopeptide repeat protein [Thermodesulfobium narugense]AEE14921.1 Tetratricopeptide TPR_1 repeat-containing protein [Thermodesulfobium narugense DSM 14796]
MIIKRYVIISLIIFIFIVTACYAAGLDDVYKQAEEKLQKGDALGCSIELTKALLQMDKNNPLRDKFLTLRGKCFYVDSDLTEASKDFNEAILLNPNNSEGYYGLAKINEETGNIDTAINFYTKAIEINSHVPKFYFGRAIDYYLEKKYDQSLEDVDNAIKLEPRSEYFLFKASLEQSNGKIDDALSTINSAYKLYPNSLQILEFKSSLELEKGDYENALLDVNKALEIDSKKADLFFLKGNILYDLSNFQGSLEALNFAISLDPNQSDYYAMRAKIEDSLKQPKKALDDIETALSISQNKYYYFQKAYYEYELNKYKDAKKDIEAALSLDPENSSFKDLKEAIDKKL